jgi:predicted anti-sigma-YlaC factor YlaD
MDCKETLNNLSLLLDGELANGVEQEVLEHIQNCWHCTEVKENEARLKEIIKEKLAYRLTVPSSVTAAIKEIIYKS